MASSTAQSTGRSVRVLAVASREVDREGPFGPADERDLTIEGFLLFFDPPKAGVDAVVRDLGRLGVRLKVITGDHRDVAREAADFVLLRPGRARALAPRQPALACSLQ